MKVMSEGIQKTAGSRLRDILAYMTQNRFAGVFTGFLTTCLVQSSSATTVMTISFVNAGLLTLVQSIGIIMGANIGTTITGWMVSILGFKFSIISIALPSVGIGLPLIFSKITKRKNLGEIFVGFGLLFLGLKFLKQSVPEVDSEILAFLSGYTQLGILSLLIFIAVGVILTIVVQSSSAAMTITITMAYSGWIDFPTACALVLGENIGTTITAYLASLNANYHAKRTARAHMIFNIAGVAWMIISFKYFIKFIDKILLDSHVPYSTDVYNSSPELFMNIPIHLSLFHTLFNIINVLLLIWFVPQIASIVERMVSPSEEEKEDDQYKLEYFSTGVQPVPEIAIIEVKKEVIKMSSKMIKMLNFFMETYKDRKNMTKSVSKAKKLEYLSDQMQEQISTYLAECTKHELSFESSKGAAAMMRIANELESVGDSTLNLFLQLERMEDGLKFDDRMNKEVLEIFNLVMKFIAWNHSFIKNDIQSMTEEHLYKSIEYEKEIDDIRNQFIDLSRERLSKGSNPKAELLFLDIVKHLEHIGDFSLNISQALEQLD
jgi:phosphate:Na+ symporter|tara:strand:- start:418 stop:2061 length:1644 start_codon:yes stop_codon:yes gene_type:complete